MDETQHTSINKRFTELMSFLTKRGSDLAKELDVTKATITRTTKGDTLPSSKLLIPLGKKLGVSIDWLLFGDGEMFRAETKTNSKEKDDLNNKELQYLSRENKQLRDQLKDKEVIIRLLQNTK